MVKKEAYIARSETVVIEGITFYLLCEERVESFFFNNFRQ